MAPSQPQCADRPLHPACSDVRRLSRGAMRRQQRQQRQQQQRAKPAGNGLPNRWLAADTCSLCGHDTKRLMQRDPGQRQGQAGQQQAKQPAQAAQSSQQQAAAGQADTVVPALPASSDMPPAQPPTEADIAGTAMQHGAAPPLPIDQQQGGHLVGVQQQRQEQQQRQGQQGQQPLLLQQQKEEQVLQAAPLQLVAAAQSLGTEDVAGHRVGGFLKVADTQLPAASDGQQSVEDGEMGSGEEAAAVPHGSCSGESPPEKRRRLSWSDQLQAVRLIDRAPRPQPKKLVSWHRLARSWKAAKLSLAHGGGGG